MLWPQTALFCGNRAMISSLNTQHFSPLTISPCYSCFILHALKKSIHLFISERRVGREKERERNITVWLPLACPPLGAWHATQACALTGNRTNEPLLPRRALNPLRCTNLGCFCYNCKFLPFDSLSPSHPLPPSLPLATTYLSSVSMSLFLSFLFLFHT